MIYVITEVIPFWGAASKNVLLNLTTLVDLVWCTGMDCCGVADTRLSIWVKVLSQFCKRNTVFSIPSSIFE